MTLARVRSLQMPRRSSRNWTVIAVFFASVTLLAACGSSGVPRTKGFLCTDDTWAIAARDQTNAVALDIKVVETRQLGCGNDYGFLTMEFTSDKPERHIRRDIYRVAEAQGWKYDFDMDVVSKCIEGQYTELYVDTYFEEDTPYSLELTSFPSSRKKCPAD